MSDNSSPAKSNEVEVLDRLSDMFQTAHEAVLAAESNALDSAIKAGTVLHAIRERVSSMKAWMAGHKPSVGVSTFRLYLQLADSNNRLVIEAARKTNPHLSIGAARKLLVKRPRPQNKSASNTDKSEGEEIAVPPITDEQLIAALEARGPEWLIENMPGWRAWLQARLRGQILRAEQAKHPNVRMRHLRIVHSEPPTHH
jgi:hypothetical protein